MLVFQLDQLPRSTQPFIPLG